MVIAPPLFIITVVVLLCGIPTDAQDADAIHNFQTYNNSTHITFSWDISDGYYSSSDITYFTIYYRSRLGSSNSIYISYSNTELIKHSSSFQYTTTLTRFSSYGQIMMWVRAYRRRHSPSYSFSEQIFVDVGWDHSKFALEVNIKLGASQTCKEFIAQSTSTYSIVQNEVYWFIRRYCQCNYNYFRYINVHNGYFICPAGGYVTFRAHLYSTSVTADPADLKSILTNWLYGLDTDKTMTIYGRRYSVEPGPCGVTIPHLYAPECSTPTATQAVDASSTTPAARDSIPGNTAVIVASVFATMFFILSLGLIGYILAARRCQTTRSTGARVARTTRPSNVPRQAATRREQPINTRAKQECELEPRYYPNPDEIYTEMEDF